MATPRHLMETVTHSALISTLEFRMFKSCSLTACKSSFFEGCLSLDPNFYSDVAHLTSLTHKLIPNDSKDLLTMLLVFDRYFFSQSTTFFYRSKVKRKKTNKCVLSLHSDTQTKQTKSEREEEKGAAGKRQSRESSSSR